MREDKDLAKQKDNFVLLRMTYLRGVDLNQFTYDYDQTWMAFFLDAEGRIYCRYGSRDAAFAESHNSITGLEYTMQQVLRIHKDEAAKEKPPRAQLPARRPGDIPALHTLGYGGSCVRCHMVHEAEMAQRRKEGKFKPGDFWLYPLPENVGITLDRFKGDVVKEVQPDSFAARAGLKVGDLLRCGNGTRLLTRADLQFVLNGLEAKSTLNLVVERDGEEMPLTLDLDGDWKRWDTSWRKSVYLTAMRTTFARALRPVSGDRRKALGIADGDIGLRFADLNDELRKCGFEAEDVIVAFDGKRRVPYKRVECYPTLEHAPKDRMEVTVHRAGKEVTVIYVVP